VFNGGDLYPMPDFEVSDLSDQDARSLLDVLKRYIPTTEWGMSWLFNELRERFGLKTFRLGDD
jgi:hypothetical protein